MNNRKVYWSDEEFIKIVLNNKSISDVLRYYNLPVTQAHYRKRFYFDIKRLNLKIDYGTDQTEIDNNNGKSIKPNSRLKSNLIKKGLLAEQCYICKLTDWLNQKISLHLDHIDGNRNNNDLLNLRLLCPNCHSQTDTYCNKNVKNKWKPQTNPMNHCVDCDKYRKKRRPNGRCKECYLVYKTNKKQ